MSEDNLSIETFCQTTTTRNNNDSTNNEFDRYNNNNNQQEDLNKNLKILTSINNNDNNDNNKNIDKLLRKSRNSSSSLLLLNDLDNEIVINKNDKRNNENDDNNDNDDDDDDDDDDNDNQPKRKRFCNNNNNNNNNNSLLNNNNNNNNDNKTKSTTITTSKKDNNSTISTKSLIQQQQDMEVRFLVSSRDAGAIIGRGGSNITHLRQTYESSITVPDCLSPERILTIVANVDKIIKIIREILVFIDSTVSTTNRTRFNRNNRKIIGNNEQQRSSTGNKNEKGSLNFCEIRLLLHTSHAGGLIGKGGSRITQLREDTKAGIKVYSECCPQSTERVCAVTGSLDVVQNAIGIILKVIRTFPIKGANQLYNPANFDPFMSLRYGGYGEPTTGGQPPPHPFINGPHSFHQPLTHHEPGRTNSSSIFTSPTPPSQYHHQSAAAPPPPPIHHPHGHHHHHHLFSAPPATSNRHLLTLTNEPPPPPPSQAHNHLMDRPSTDFGAASPSPFLASHHPHQHPHPHWAQTTNSGSSSSVTTDGAGGNRMATTMRALSAAAAASGNSANVFGTAAAAAASGNLFRWITDAKQRYDNTNNPLQQQQSTTTTTSTINTLMKRDDVTFIMNPNGTAMATIKVNHKVVGAIIGKGGNRIKEIRIKTRADISIDQMKNNQSISASASGGNTRLITVKGLFNDVQAAVSMICNCIDENQ